MQGYLHERAVLRKMLQKLTEYTMLPALVCIIMYNSCLSFSFSIRVHKQTTIMTACISILGVTAVLLKSFFSSSAIPQRHSL